MTPIDSGISSAFSRLLQQIDDVSEGAGKVSVCRAAFQDFSSCMLKVGSLLKEVQDGFGTSMPSVYSIVQPLESQLNNAKELVHICTVKSRFYLVLNCRTYRDRIQAILNAVVSSLSQMLLDDAPARPNLKRSIELLSDDIRRTEILLSREESDLMNTIDRMAIGYTTEDDAKISNDLLRKMATAARVSSDSLSLKQEYEKLKRETEPTSPGKHEIGEHQLRQVIATLNSADAFASTAVITRQQHEQRREMDSDFIPPLQTFNCPITQDIMENPVEIESGHTFEMTAIQRWFEEGNRVCPVTKAELRSLSFRPNRLLKQSIEEWRDLNTKRKIAKFGGRLKSDEEETISRAVVDIQRICEEKSIHKYWIASEGLIPLLVNHLGSSKGELRKRVLATLSALSADNSENRVSLCDAGAIERAVRSLARDAAEAQLAVTLLLELSREEALREKISNVQGPILLLVTIANSDNIPAATNAKELLELLATNDKSVILMAKSNYFKPFLQSLDEGSSVTKTQMAKTLAEMQLSDQNKTLLVQGGALVPLIKMLSVGNSDGKAAALEALRSLSDLSESRDHMIEAGIMQPLLDILLTVKSVSAIVREHAAATFANLVAPSSSIRISDSWGMSQSQIEEFIPRLVAILNFPGPNIQSHVLRALYWICSNSMSMTSVETFKEDIGIEMFVRFIEAPDTDVRLNGLKLLFYLTKEGGGDVLSKELTVAYYRTMVGLVQSDSSEEEKTVTMGILSILPMTDKEVTQNMLDAGVLPLVISILEGFCSRMSGRSNIELVENAARVLTRFTHPADVQLQLDTAKLDVISLSVDLLSFGTPLIKCWAATSLMQFSENTPRLCVPPKTSGGCFCFMRPQDPKCVLHGGPCTVNSTFCLLEANAISPLVQALEDKDEKIDEAALGALVTLCADKYWEKGSDIIVERGGVRPIIRKLSTQNTKVQEKALLILEKVLRRENYRAQFGQMAQMPLVSLTQEGTSTIRPLAARILAHLNILHEQSTYF